ncbi:MAG TPA: TetR/AcrR family transcriptional regulator [Deltaproteobacteria bacterium]|nr:TetR/AcrR family transcriptional regulator [Deltaproteobacteria bacterium]
MSVQFATKPRKQPRQARSKRMVRALLDATAKVLVEEGWSAASTNRVADVAGVSVGSLYQYFPNKESLVLTLAREHGEAQLQLLSEALEKVQDLPIQEAIACFVDATLASHRSDPELHVHLTASVLAHGLSSIHELHGVARPLVRQYLEQFRDQLAVTDLDTATFLLVTTVESAIHGAILESPERLEDPVFERELVALVCRYLGVEAPVAVAQPQEMLVAK